MKIGCILIALVIMLCSCGAGLDEPIAVSKDGKVNYDDMKAMWISQYDLAEVYTKGGVQRERSDFEARIDKMLDNVVSIGINTVIVQVRPFADSMYPSDVYPASSFVTGKYGTAMDYDPFEIILEKAHERDLSVHAWINPLRAMTGGEIQGVSDDFKIRRWYDTKYGQYVVEVSNRLYLNPSYDEVAELICEGAREIVRFYDVDGIHLDDYFYPTTEESFDDEAYEEYRTLGGDEDRAQFRRNNVSRLVQNIYSAVKNENEDVLFGISPAGVTSNNYNKLYADVAEWCSGEKYVDYICPQVYFGFEHSTCDFIKVCREFSDMIQNDNVRLIIGMTLGKAVSEIDVYAGEGRDEWRNNKDILKRELEHTMTMEKCSGVAYFCYQYFFDPVSGEEIDAAREERNNLLPLIKNASW